MTFEFPTDENSRAYCARIAAQMIRLFGISEDEALGRINRAWKGKPFVGPNDLIYHRNEEYWANTIYYGNGSLWWTRPPDLEPLKYP